MLKFFKKTNIPHNYVIASWHNPKSYTWRWSIWWHWSWKLMAKSWIGHNGHGQLMLSIPLIGSFTFNWQPSCWKGPTP